MSENENLNFNEYEARRAARIERMRRAAERKDREAKARLAEVDKLVGVMSGQPILVGHHSEKRHRRDVERMDANMRKGLDLSLAADELRRRASAAEDASAISSDDPEAQRKIRDRIAELEQRRADLKKQPHERWELANSATNIRRLRARLTELERAAAAPAAEPRRFDGFTVEERPADNRIAILFDRKPSELVRSALKREGFRWSPANEAWQRQLNNAGRAAAESFARCHARMVGDGEGKQ